MSGTKRYTGFRVGNFLTFVGLVGGGLALYNHSTIQLALCLVAFFFGQYLNFTKQGTLHFRQGTRLADYGLSEKLEEKYGTGKSEHKK